VGFSNFIGFIVGFLNEIARRCQTNTEQ